MPNTSPNMGMPIPTVSVDSGPGWAQNLDNSLSIIDSHDHSSGKGTPVITAGININADLPFNSFNATGLRTARFVAQGSPLSLPTDKGCIYVSGVDLYYNDGNGVNIRLTTAGAISGTPGSISGLVAPASASYSVPMQTFIWQSNTNVPANMQFASISIGQAVASPNFITISSPVSLAAAYTLTLPTSLPPLGTTQALVADSSGNLKFVNTTGTIVGPGGAFSTINAAITATAAGGYITVLPGTYTESVTLTKNLTIVGQGNGTILNGSLTFASGSDNSIWQNFRHTGSITINSGVNEISVLSFWLATGNTITDNGPSSYIQGFQE